MHGGEPRLSLMVAEGQKVSREKMEVDPNVSNGSNGFSHPVAGPSRLAGADAESAPLNGRSPSPRQGSVSLCVLCLHLIVSGSTALPDAHMDAVPDTARTGALLSFPPGHCLTNAQDGATRSVSRRVTLENHVDSEQSQMTLHKPIEENDDHPESPQRIVAIYRILKRAQRRPILCKPADSYQEMDSSTG